MPATLALCMIVRDEEEALARCLESVRSYVDEIVVVDTGSEDGSVALAERLGARVISHEWKDDFSEARNVSLEAATSDWVLVLDADEWVESGPVPADLRSLLRRAEGNAYTIEIADRLDGGGERRYSLVRLFRNGPRHRYSGAFHEQIAEALSAGDGRPLQAPPSGLVVGHAGYLSGRRNEKAKAERNLERLRALVRQNDDDAAARYFLARELVPVRNGRAVPGSHITEALKHFNWLDAHRGELLPPLESDADRLHAAALLAAGRAEDAGDLLANCPDRGVACDLLRADVAIETGDKAALESALDRVKACFDRETRHLGPFSEPRLAGAVARVRASEILLRIGRPEDAEAMASEAARMPGGRSAACCALAAIQLERGRLAAALRAYVDGLREDQLDPWAWAGLGETILQHGEAGEAIEQLRNAAMLAPGWTRAEEALIAACLLAGKERELPLLFGPGDGVKSPAARAAMLLSGALNGEAQEADLHEGLEEIFPVVERILARLAAKGRTSLLSRLQRGLQVAPETT